MEVHKPQVCITESTPVATLSKKGGDTVNVDLNWKHCVVKYERRKMGAWGLATEKMFKATPSRAPEKKAPLEHRIKIGVFSGLLPFAVA